MFGGVGSGIYGGSRGLYGTLANYGTLNLTVASPPQSFVEPLTLDDVKRYIGLPERSPLDAEEDLQLESMITAARGQAEILQGRDLVRKQWDLSLDFWIDYFFQLRSPLASVDLFTLRDSTGSYTTLVENRDYIVDTLKDPGVVAPPYNTMWPVFTPWPSSAILIRFTSGFAADSIWWKAGDGDRIKNGMRLLISNWFTGRLPFEQGIDPAKEYPFGLTACLSQGAIRHVA